MCRPAAPLLSWRIPRSIRRRHGSLVASACLGVAFSLPTCQLRSTPGAGFPACQTAPRCGSSATTHRAASCRETRYGSLSSFWPRLSKRATTVSSPWAVCAGFPKPRCTASLRVLLAPAVLPPSGIQSNHCRATAAAARRLGLEPHLILRTDATSDDPGLVGNLMIDRLVGARLHLVSGDEFAAKGQAQLVSDLSAQLQADGRRYVRMHACIYVRCCLPAYACIYVYMSACMHGYQLIQADGRRPYAFPSGRSNEQARLTD